MNPIEKPDFSHLFRRTGIDLVFNPESDVPRKLVEALEQAFLTDGLKISAAMAKENYAPQQLMNEVRAYLGLDQPRRQKLTTACMNIADELSRRY